jgi:Transposase IS4
MSSETHRWMLIDDHVSALNIQRKGQILVTDTRICVDESFSHWYGCGGNWINTDLPHCISMDRKPEAGCEIWSCCDGRVGIMIQLKIVKSEEVLSFIENETRHNNAQLNLGTKGLLDLVRPWYNSNRVVVVDSYFLLFKQQVVFWKEV